MSSSQNSKRIIVFGTVEDMKRLCDSTVVVMDELSSVSSDVLSALQHPLISYITYRQSARTFLFATK